MKRSWLIQRLKEPKNFTNPFSFGGGLVNGGLSDKAMDLIKPIFSFDYMGAAEFEWGDVPKAFGKILEYSSQGETICGTIELVRPTFYLCSNEQKNHVEDLITKIAKEGDYGSLRFKESTHFKEALEQKEHYSNYQGWLELDNGFMFFVDKPMYKKTLDLFQIPCAEDKK